MSETTAEFLTPTLTDLLQVVVWGGLAAGALLVWRPRLAKQLVLIQAALAAGIAVCLVPLFLSGGDPTVVDYGSWLAIPPEASAGLRIAHRADLTAAMLLFAVATAFLLVAEFTRIQMEAAPVPRLNSREFSYNADFRQSAGPGVLRFLFLQAVLQFVLIDDAVLRVAFLPLMSLCRLLEQVTVAAATSGEAVAARRTFLFRAAGAALLLLGAALLALTGTVGSAAGMLLCIGVVVHAAGYPFFSADDSPSDDPLERVLVLPAGIVVLLRIQTDFAGVDLIEHGLLSSGLALAILAASVAAARPQGWLAAVAVALTGMMLAGLGSGNASGVQGAVLLFVSTAVVLPLLRTTGTDSIPGPTSAPQKDDRRRKMDQLAFAGLLLLGLGIGGPGMIFAALFSRPSTLFAGGLLAAAHLLVAFAVIRGTRLNWYSSRTPLAVGWVAVLTLAALVVAVQASGAPILWPAYMFEYALLAILGAIGLTAGWMTRQAESGRRKAEGGKRKPVRPPTSGLRWLRAGFYLEEVFLLAVVLPLRAAAQLCRFFEWFIIERLWELPRRATEWLGGLGEPLQGGTVRLSVAAILLATAALLGVIVGW